MFSLHSVTTSVNIKPLNVDWYVQRARLMTAKPRLNKYFRGLCVAALAGIGRSAMTKLRCSSGGRIAELPMPARCAAQRPLNKKSGKLPASEVLVQASHT